MRIACYWGPVAIVLSSMVVCFLVIGSDQKPGPAMLKRMPGGMSKVLVTWPFGGEKPKLLNGRPTRRAIVAKSIHVAIFVCWSFFLARALNSTCRSRMAVMYVTVLLTSFVLGFLTESAQAAGKGRDGQMLDVGFNAAGSVLGLCAFWFLRSRGISWVSSNPPKGCSRVGHTRDGKRR